MVYAYDKWEGLPVMQLYDTDIMKMSIAAAKDMYEKGQQQIKDFSTTYGDFITPIQRDQEWYNQNVTGKFRRAIDDLYAKGIDPIRSAEGRMLLSRIANSVDVGQVAKLRTSAENAREFLKARKQLEAQGLYNPLLAKYDGPDINSYSTLESGAWDKMSPTKIVDMATFGNPYYEGMKPNVHSASKNGVSYSIEAITEDDLKGIANSHFNELVSTAQGQLMYKYYQDLARQAGSNDVAGDAREMFNKAVVDGQRRRIYQKDDYDDQWAKRQQISQGWAKINQDRDQFNWQKFTDMMQLGIDPRTGLPIDQSKTDLSYTTQMEVDSVQKYNKEAGIGSPADYAKTTYDIAKYWENKASKEKDAKKKAYAEKMQDYWLRMNKAGLDKAEKNGVLVRDKATGELIPSKVYAKEIGLAYGAPATGKTSADNARRQADIYYNKFLTSSGGDEYNKASADFLAGGDAKTSSFPGGSATNKYRVVSFNDKDIYFTPMRRMQVAGYLNNPQKAPIINAFNDWLKKSPRLGYMVNANTTTASLPRPDGGRTREISGYARIPHSEFAEFVNEYKKTHTDIDSQSIYDALGLSMYKMQSSVPIGGKKQWENADVVEIPITRVRNNYNSTVDSKWNTHYDKLIGGQSAAEKKLIERQKESLNKK